VLNITKTNSHKIDQIPKLNGTCRSIQKILMPASNKKNVVQKKVFA